MRGHEAPRQGVDGRAHGVGRLDTVSAV
jgi:hypothetical protein